MSDENSEKEKGNAAFRRGDYAAALTHYDNAIKNTGRGAGAALFANKAEWEEYDLCALQCFKALAAPGLTEELKSKVYRRLGNAYKAQGKWEKAMEAFQKSESIAAALHNGSPGDASWESYQTRGNELLAAGKYELAIFAYTEAIELKRKVAPKEELADLFAERAAAYLAEELPMDAYWDCQSALFVQPGHVTGTLRLANAHGNQSKYAEAKEILEKSPHTTRPEFRTEISRFNRLLREQQTGDYDLKSMLKEAAASKTPRLDHAEYNGGVEVRWISEQRGNGLVALRDFAPGDLLFVCKAFEAVYKSECKARIDVKPGKLAPFDASQNECTFRIFRRISRNKDLAKEFYRLYAGPDFERISEDDAIGAIDAARVGAIVSLISIGLCDAKEEAMLEGERPGFAAVRSGFQFGGCGVWVLGSFTNHSCVPNIARYFVGDLMFVRAAKPIQQGQELTTSYVSSACTYERRRQILETVFGIHCDCALCVCDQIRIAEEPQLDFLREEFMDAFDAIFTFDNTKSFDAVMDDARKAVAHFSSGLAYKGRYDQDLKAVYMALGTVYNAQRNYLQAAEAFEMAYFAIVGNGTSDNDTFGSNFLARYACHLCFHIMHNYVLALRFAKAKEYLRKMQIAAKILWGSADKELLEIMYPGLDIKLLVEALA